MDVVNGCKHDTSSDPATETDTKYYVVILYLAIAAKMFIIALSHPMEHIVKTVNKLDSLID